MRGLRIITWNVKGLRNPVKKQRVLSHLARMKCQVALLQESHLKLQDLTSLRKQWVGEMFCSPAVNNKNGVIILFHKSLNVTLLNEFTDANGRWIYLDVKVNGHQLSFCNVYGPNNIDLAFWNDLSIFLSSHSAEHLIMGGGTVIN